MNAFGAKPTVRYEVLLTISAGQWRAAYVQIDGEFCHYDEEVAKALVK